MAGSVEPVVTAGAAAGRRVGAAVPRRGQHRLARDVARGRGRRALDGQRRRRRRRRDRARHAGRSASGSSAATCCWRSTTGRWRTSPMSSRRCTRRSAATTLRYTIAAARHRATSSTCAWRRFPTGPGALYFVLAAVGIFTLLVGGAVRLRRPRDPATLHFFWLAVAFFGVFTFSFSGRLDRLDWVFYWADAISILALPPLFLHFTLVFPERPRRWTRRRGGPRASWCVAYAPAVVLGLARVVAVARSSSDAAQFVRITDGARSARVPLPGASASSAGCSAAHARAVAGPHDHRAAAAALDRVGHGARRRAVRARLRAAVRARRRAVAADGAVGDSAQPDPAGLRVGDRPLPADGHRGDRQARAGLRRGAVGDRRDLRGAARRRAAHVRPGGAGQPVGASRCWRRWSPCCWRRRSRRSSRTRSIARSIAIATTTAARCVGFARDLNSDLDLNRLAERLVSRVVETLLVDRMALMLEDESAPHFGSVRALGIRRRASAGAAASARASAARLADGHVVALDDPIAVGRFAAEEIEFWRDAGPLLLRAVRREGRDDRGAGARAARTPASR